MAKTPLTPEQLDAVRAQAGPVVVSAAAGSGKTRVLVERFVHLVREQGVRPDAIVAVTFTERAAGEMRRRVASRFAELGMEPERRAAERAHVETIHALASSILRENAAMAGVDPAFRIIDETEKRLVLHRLLRRTLDDDPFYAEILARRGAPALMEAAMGLADHERGRGRSPQELLAESEDPGAVLARTLDAMAEEGRGLVEHLAGLASALDPGSLKGETAKKASKFKGLIEGLRAGGALDRKALEALRENTLRVKNCPELSRAKDVIDGARGWIVSDEEVERELALDRAAVTRLAGGMLLLYEQEKAAGGTVDYEDLLIRCRDLLASSALVREGYRSRFAAVMVDEYQDTDPLQTEILGFLAPEPGRFAVGDVMQSIYGFRRARPKLFEDAASRAASSGSLLKLAGNFRSTAGLIDLANEFFGRLRPVFHGEPMRSERLAGTFPPADSPAVEVLLTDRPEPEKEPGEGVNDEAPAPEASSMARWAGAFAEAEGVLSRLVELVDSGAQVFDQADGRLRPMRFGDIGILLRTRGEAFRAFEAAFGAAGVPLAVSGGRHFFERREITDLLKLLSVVHNPLGDHDLAAVLRSPLVGLSDDALALAAAARPDDAPRPVWRERASLWWGLVAAVDLRSLPEHDIERAGSFIRLRERLAGAGGAGGMIRLAIDETGYDARLLARAGGTRALANARELERIAGRFDRRTGGGLGGWLRYVEELRLLERSSVESPPDAEDSEAASLLTMHAAKGLEFPVVVLADLGYDFLRQTANQEFFASDELGIAMKPVDEYGIVPDDAKGSFELARRRELEKVRAEEMRLLYVAVTRARDRLLLSGVLPGKEPKDVSEARSMLDWVRHALETDEVGRTAELGRARVLVARPRPSPGRARKRVCELFGPEGLRLGEAMEAPAGAEPGKGDVEAARAAVRRVLHRVETRPLPSSIQATALRDFAVSPGLYLRRHVLMSDEPEEEAWGSLGSAAFGLAVHRAMELADYSASAPGSAAEAQAKKLAAACLRAPEFSRADRERASEQMRRFLSSPRARLIHGARWVGRETPVAVRIGPTTVHGVADLVWLAQDGSAGVLDFKTDDATPERTIERMTSEYRTQLIAYALAAARALGVSEISAELAFLSEGELVRLDGSPGGLRAMEEDLAGVLRRLGEWESARALLC